MRKIFNIIFIAILGTLVYFSTYGWHMTKASVSVFSSDQESMARDLKEHVYALSQQIGWRNVEQYENLDEAAKYITDYFKELKLRVETRAFVTKGKLVSNIVAEKRGVKFPEKIIIVGAHYDTYYNPGADNNASGIAALLELANIFSKEEVSATLRFIAFVNKEPPFSGTTDMGSATYIRDIKKNNENINAVIILDSIGYYSNRERSQRYPPLLGFFYPDKGNFIAVAGNFDSLTLLRAVESVLKKNISLPIKGVVGFDFINSDHASFWKEKINAVLVTDTGPYRNPNFYSLADTPEKLNYLNMSQIVGGLASVLKGLAN